MEKRKMAAYGVAIGIITLLALLPSTAFVMAGKPSTSWSVTFSGCITGTVQATGTAKTPCIQIMPKVTLSFSDYWDQAPGLEGTFICDVSMIQVRTEKGTWSVGISHYDGDITYFIQGTGKMTSDGLGFTFVPSGSYFIWIYDKCCTTIFKGHTDATPPFVIIGIRQ